jgi:hypothetical protein
MKTTQPPPQSLSPQSSAYRRLQINYSRNQVQDHTQALDQAAAGFCYDDCKQAYWNPEEFSLLYGTALWEQASTSQRLVLNQLYWVAYYSQIISAEIATIYFNQTSAAGLYALEDFRLVCDTLDLESAQERAHIHAFRQVSKQVEQSLFGQSIFTYAMRGPFAETMVCADTNALKTWWKQLQLQAFGLISANNAFLACQYFTVRGVRTLNGKLVQHKLSQVYQIHPDPEQAPIPAQISHYHFLDESFHFNSSTILSQDVIHCLPAPTPWETQVANLGIRGCQRDHLHFSAAMNGIFWYDPALYPKIYKVLRSPLFGLEAPAAISLMRRCFTEESEGLYRSYQTHQEALHSYRIYVEKLGYLWPSNREMSLMATSSIPGYLHTQRQAMDRFERQAHVFSEGGVS